MVAPINPVNMKMTADIEFQFQCRSFQSINVIFFKANEFANENPFYILDTNFNDTVTLFGFNCFLFSLFSGTYGLQRFAEQPKYTEVNPGEDALLTCKIIDKRGSCSWQKDNKVSWSTQKVFTFWNSKFDS